MYVITRCSLQITEKDEAVLEHLVDISAEEVHGDEAGVKIEGKGEDEADDDEGDDQAESGFRLTFTFEPNEFFSETVLVRRLLPCELPALSNTLLVCC